MKVGLSMIMMRRIIWAVRRGSFLGMCRRESWGMNWLIMGGFSWLGILRREGYLRTKVMGVSSCVC